MLLQDLEEKGLIRPPHFLSSNTMALFITGSHAYGCADTSVKSKIPDYDTYGFCIPPKDMVFRTGEIQGFGTPLPKFDQFSQHGIIDKDAHGGKGQEWDVTIFNIVKYFELCRQGNPNMVDTLFVPKYCIIHSTQVAQKVMDNRRLFVSKEIWTKFRGYAWSQMTKMNGKKIEAHAELEEIAELEEALDIDTKISWDQTKAEFLNRQLQREACEDGVPSLRPSLPQFASVSDDDFQRYYAIYERGVNKSARFEIHKVHKYDVKFAYHLFRLLDEAEQLLANGEMDLQRGKETMKAIRRGDWSKEDLINWAQKKESELDILFTNCKLPDKAPEAKLKQLLVDCLEMHYGSLADVIPQQDWALDTLKKLDVLMAEVRPKLFIS